MNTNPREKLRTFIFVPLRNLPLRWCLTCAERQANGAARNKLQGGGEPERTGKRSAQNGGIMGSMKKWMLGAALAVGALAMTAAPAQAARIGFYVGARTVAIPACPDPDTRGWAATGMTATGFPATGTSSGFASAAPSFAAAWCLAVGPAVYRRLLPRRFPPLA